MNILEDLLKNKESILLNFIQLLEGKSVSTKLDLTGIEFSLGRVSIKLDGEIDITLSPTAGKKKK